ncbi:MAG: diguanylate cyclase [Candidatus Eisenbacteria bacterium]|nr:diguanylate cyclase [Candidatus Eisenbacteria bacterium]
MASLLSVHKVSKTDRIIWIMCAAVMMPVIGALDYYTGPDVTFSLLYLIPVSITAWFVGRMAGIGISAINAGIWLYVDFAAGRVGPGLLVYSWNFFSRLVFLIIVSVLISALRRALQHQYQLARIDPLTRGLNSLAFGEIAEAEISRSERYHHPLSIAYLDIDNFKEVNDTHGHRVGDKLLMALVGTIRKNIRKTDSVARLGGDEFAMLFPEADQAAARAIVAKVQNRLTNIFHRKHWPVSLSIGVVTYIKMPPSVDKMIEDADKLMYSVKGTSKNAVSFMEYTG